MALTFTKAERKQKKARIAIYGASGSGKTYTALSIATGLGKPIAFIDTERGSASLYSDKFNFDVLELEQFHPDKFIEAIHAAEQANYGVIIIDSITHAWQEILNLVDARGGNSFTDGWGKIGTPLYKKLIDAILACKAHVIVCMRSKTEYAIEETVNASGKTVKAPKKIGTAPVMRPDTEYEFDLVCFMDEANNMTISKTRMGDTVPQRVNRPTAATGKLIAQWLMSGKEASPPPALTPLTALDEITRIIEADNFVKPADRIRELFAFACAEIKKRGMDCEGKPSSMKEAATSTDIMLGRCIDYDNKQAAEHDVQA
jgi:hypothetical protein